jgi:hypothetical protein
MHEHATDAKYFSGIEQAKSHIADQRATDTSAMI